MDAKKVFVAGCRGQLGHDALAVLPPEYVVTGMDLPELDITSPESVVRVLGASDAGTVLNCAAYTNVDRSESDVDNARRVNADGPRLLAKYAESHGALLVHVSTDYVFDGERPAPEPYTEADRPRPQGVYGLTKLEGELAIRGTTERYIIVRTAWLYGAHGNNFLKTMLRLALANPEKPIRVVNDQHGCPTWSERLARQIKVLIARGQPGLYHATGEGHCTWFELASAFLRLMNIPHRIEPCTTADFPTPTRRPANSILANARLKEAGLHVMHHWHDDLAEYVRRHHDALLAETRAKLAAPKPG
ncbi:MAG: dTDP-4-dehydrorhamnose reductase [Lentisphaerae bacterium]|nr:dTDP-4-dehydrorhamnose reductase [Lentisphaerota bacterium]